MKLTQWLRGLFSRALTQPTVPLASRLFWAGRTNAGIRVTPDTALQDATVWACVQYLTRAVGQLPWRVMVETAAGGSEIATGRDATDVDWLLHHRPCPEMGSFSWRQSMLGCALLWGNGYAEIERNVRGTPIALWPIHPDRVCVRRNEILQLEYEVWNNSGGSVVLAASDIFHLRGFGDGPVGYNVIEYAAQSIGWAQATQIFGSTFFGEGMNPSGVVETPNALSPEALSEMRAAFKQLYSGPKGERTMFLDAGMKFQRLANTPEDSQFIETRQHQVEEICFIPGTQIITPWGPRIIEEIEVGERVLTHRGRWRRVTNVMRRDYVGKVVTVQAKGLEAVTATAIHPFYALTLKKDRRGHVQQVANASWIGAEHLSPGQLNASGNRTRRPFHALTFSKLRHDAPIRQIDLLEWAGPGAVADDHTVRWSDNVRATECIRRPAVDYNFGWLCGLFAGDGSTSDKQAIFYIGAGEIETNEQLHSNLLSVLGVDSTRTIVNAVARTVVSNRTIAAFFADFGHSSADKRLPAWCMAGSEEFQRGLLDGLIDSDGCVYRERTQLRTTSLALAWQTRVLLWARGLNSTLQTSEAATWTINGRSGPSLPIMTVEWRPSPQRPGTMFDSGDVVGFSLNVHKESIYRGSVFNLEVEDDQSYTTLGGVVHNCRWFGCPPHKVMHLLRATFSNIEHQSIEVVTDNVTPWVKLFEEEANYKLFGQNRSGLFTKMNLRGLLRGDAASRSAFYKTMFELGMTINQILALEDMNGIGADGDVSFVSNNVQTLERAIRGQPIKLQPAAGDPLPDNLPPIKPNGAANGQSLPH